MSPCCAAVFATGSDRTTRTCMPLSDVCGRASDAMEQCTSFIRPSETRDERSDFVEAVRFYLQLKPRQLPSRFLYDTLGSSLFDAICHLPWYRITRAELALLRQAATTIGPLVRYGGRVVELGCGNGEKLA